MPCFSMALSVLLSRQKKQKLSYFVGQNKNVVFGTGNEQTKEVVYQSFHFVLRYCRSVLVETAGLNDFSLG